MAKYQTIATLSALLSTKQISAVELAKDSLDRAKVVGETTNAFTSFNHEETLLQAKRADELIQNGQTHPLCGIPYVLKDVYSTQKFVTTCASNVLREYTPPYNATIYDKLLQIGSVLIGKNNQDAWGHGGSSENSDYGPVKNPWDLDRVAGGSSGGTAVSIATGASTFGVAEDTGGSIRNPACYNNLTGLKVTYGRVSRYGAIAYASSFDTMGPLAHTAEDCALIMETLAGYDAKDASSSHEPIVEYLKHLETSLKDKVIGVPSEFFDAGLNPEIKLQTEKAIQKLVDLGMKVKEICLPTAKYGSAIYYILTFAETSSNLARFDGVRYGNSRDAFSPETKRRIMLGTFGLSSGYYEAYYQKASQARTTLIREFDEAYKTVDVIASPVMPFLPYPIGNIASEFSPDQLDIATYLADLYTVLANTVGVPAISMPVGFSQSGLPIGMQLHGKMFAEQTLLNIAHQYQQATSWHLEVPNI